MNSLKPFSGLSVFILDKVTDDVIARASKVSSDRLWIELEDRLIKKVDANVLYTLAGHIEDTLERGVDDFERRR